MLGPSESSVVFTVGVKNAETQQVQRKHVFIVFRDQEVCKEFVGLFNRIVGELRHKS